MLAGWGKYLPDDHKKQMATSLEILEHYDDEFLNHIVMINENNLSLFEKDHSQELNLRPRKFNKHQIWK